MIYGDPAIIGEKELKELYDVYLYACQESWDPNKVHLGPHEWAEEIVRGTIKLIVEDGMGKFQLGDRVHRSDGITGLAAQDGEVIINNAAIVKVEDFSGLEFDPARFNAESLTELAELVKVRWYHPTEGYVITEGWHHPSQIEVKEPAKELPDYITMAHHKILEDEKEAAQNPYIPVEPSPRLYKLWRVLTLSEQSRREFLERPEEYTPFFARYNDEQNARFNTLIDAHVKKHGKLPGNVTRWDDPPLSAAALAEVMRPKQIVQGPASLVGRRMSSYAKKKIYWLWQDRIPFGSLCTIAGDPDEGKSLITLYVAARVSRGEKLYDNTTDTEPAEVLILSAEDDPETTLRPRLEAAGANLDRIHLLESVVLKDSRGNKSERIAQLDSDIAMIGAYLDLYPQIKVVIIDPISSFLGSASLNKEQEVRRVLQPLAIRARESGLAVVMVAHFNKNSETRSAMDRVGGAKAIVGMGRAAWTCVREPEKEHQPGEPMKIVDTDRRLFLKLKGNLAPSKIGGLVYTIKTAPVEVDGKDGPVTVDVPFVMFLEKTEHTAQGVVIGDRNGKPKVADTVKGWLNGHLESAGGYAPADDVLTAATAQGYSRSTVHRARQQLGLRVVWVGRASCWALNGAVVPTTLSA